TQVTIQEAGICRCVIRIPVDRLLEQVNPLAYTFKSQLIRKKPSLEMKVIDLGILGVPFGQMWFLVCQFRSQALDYFLRNRFLQRKYVREFPSILGSPQLPVVGRIDEFTADHQNSGGLSDSAGQYSAHAQLFSDNVCFRKTVVRFANLVPKDGIP